MPYIHIYCLKASRQEKRYFAQQHLKLAALKRHFLDTCVAPLPNTEQINPPF